MKPYLKIILIVSLIGGAALLYWWFTRPKTSTAAVAADLSTSNNHWAVSDMLQGNQISSLATQLTDKVDRSEVMALIAQTPQTVVTPAPTTVISTGGGPDLTIPITQDGQTRFTVSATETRDKVFLNGMKLEPDEFTLAPPSLVYTGTPVLETDDNLTLAF